MLLSSNRTRKRELLPSKAHRFAVRQLMRQSTIFETVARRLLERQEIQVIWLLHLKASASHLDGNWLAAAAFIGIADAAERQWASRGCR